MEIELVPVIEVPRVHAATSPPSSSSSDEKEAHFKAILEQDGFPGYRPFLPGHGLYRLDQFRASAGLLRIVQIHVGRYDPDHGLPIAESCALFGGYILKVDDEVVCVPQCCGSLADFASWQCVVDPSFSEGYICNEGHPAPRLARRGDFLELSCEDDQFDTFWQPAISCTIPRDRLSSAITACEVELSGFEKELDQLGNELGAAGVGQILIHERS